MQSHFIVCKVKDKYYVYSEFKSVFYNKDPDNMIVKGARLIRVLGSMHGDQYRPISWLAISSFPAPAQEVKLPIYMLKFVIH